MSSVLLIGFEEEGLHYAPAKQMLFWVFWNQPVCVSIFVQNTSNFVSQTPPTVLLQLY